MSKEEYPQCKNKKDGTLVCLNPSCSQYPFFCTVCESEECESSHFHGDRLNSISYKEFIKRVLKDRKPSSQLENALKKYNECLEKLKKDVEQFVKKQLEQIEQIRRKSVELPEDEEEVIKKIRKKEFKGIQGRQLDKLWSSVTKLLDTKKNEETIQFLSLKEDEIKQISQNFETVNRMELLLQQQKKQVKDNKKVQEKETNNKNYDDIDDVKINDVDDRMQ